MSAPPTVLVLGAGAAGAAAAAQLTAAGIPVEIAARTGEQTVNRTLVNKAIATGLLAPELASLPVANLHADTAVQVDPAARTVRFASGATRPYDGLIIATGSVPRALPPSTPGVATAADAGLLTALHSLKDGIRVRDRLAAFPGGARIAILGGGLVAAETASLLAAAGHDIVLITRSRIPGESTFGSAIAARLADAHARHVQTRFGQQVTAVRLDGDRIGLTLNADDPLKVDLVIVAHGTSPIAPPPWPDGVAVDTRLRAVGADRVLAAGGVAMHGRHPDMLWRVDHWADAAAQGEHAARVLLHDLTGSADPGPYRPVSLYSAQIHDQMLMAAGDTGPGTRARITDGEVLLHERDGQLVGVAGVNNPMLVHEQAQRLHTPRPRRPMPSSTSLIITE